ncbi:MAG TPA: hypothetical protein VGH28_13935 [Polyangiaceae bacterium]
MTRSERDRAEIIKALEDALEHVRAQPDEPGAWAIVVGVNCAGRANTTYVGNAHEVLALATRLQHRANVAIDEMNE